MLKEKIMFKLQAKIVDEKNKLLKNELFEFYEDFDSENLYEYMLCICEIFKIETPIVLSKHKNHLNDFNFTKFTEQDFVDTINFKSLTVEIVQE